MHSTPRTETPAWFNRERVRSLGFIGVTVLVAYLCYLVARPFIPALAWAVALAVIAYPIHSRLLRRARHETSAALVTVFLVTVVIVVPALFVVREVVDEAAASIEDVQQEVAKGRWRKAVERNPQFAPVLRWIEREVNINDEISSASKQLLKGAGKVVSGSIYAAIGLLVTLFLLFYFLRDRRKVLGVTRAIVPLSDRDTDSIFSDIGDAIRAIVGGILIVAAVQGTLGGLMFWWLGLPSPVLWGTVMALLSVLPVLGAAIVWVPAAIFLALEGDWGKALILTAWGGIVIALIDNLLYPLLIKNRMQLHAVPVFIAVLGGLAVFGGVGMVVGPVILVVMVGLLEIWRRRIAAEDGSKSR